MNLFSFTFQSHLVELAYDTQTMSERVFIDGQQVSFKPIEAPKNSHSFSHEYWGDVTLRYEIRPETQQIIYQFIGDQIEPVSDAFAISDEIKGAWVIDNQTQRLVLKFAQKPRRSWIVIIGVGLKLLQTAKVAKVALGAASVAAYSILFTFEFALALIAVLVVHEYGHVRAMKKCGLPTKGFYLIPFVGGLTIGDRARSQWEALYIAMMGPVFGLAMTAVFFVIYLITNSHFCGLVASVSAFLNLVNLLPVVPLDGGQVVKALVFSRRHYVGLIVLFLFSALIFVGAWKLGYSLLCFFVVLGVVDIVANWSVPTAQDLKPLNSYGIWFSILWYLGVVFAFVAMIYLLGQSNVPGAEIVTKILAS